MVRMVRILYNRTLRWISRTSMDLERKILSYTPMAYKSRNIHMGIYKRNEMIVPTTAEFKKALRVINSCENHIQLKGAKKYINNFFKYHSAEVSSNTVNVFSVDEVIHKMYQRLLIKHAEKSVLLEV